MKGKRKPKKKMTINELLALMPKAKADKILKSRNPKMLDDGPILKSGRPGRAHITEGSYDEDEVRALRKLAKERSKAAKRVKADKKLRTPKRSRVNYEASKFSKD